MKLTLIDNAHKWWRLWSVQIFGLIAALAMLEQHWPQFKQFIPEHYHQYVVAGFALVGIISRVIKQMSLVESPKVEYGDGYKTETPVNVETGNLKD